MPCEGAACGRAIEQAIPAPPLASHLHRVPVCTCAQAPERTPPPAVPRGCTSKDAFLTFCVLAPDPRQQRQASFLPRNNISVGDGIISAAARCASILFKASSPPCLRTTLAETGRSTGPPKRRRLPRGKPNPLVCARKVAESLAVSHIGHLSCVVPIAVIGIILTKFQSIRTLLTSPVPFAHPPTYLPTHRDPLCSLAARSRHRVSMAIGVVQSMSLAPWRRRDWKLSAS